MGGGAAAVMNQNEHVRVFVMVLGYMVPLEHKRCLIGMCAHLFLL